MAVTRRQLTITTLATGALVLISYVVGIMQATEADALWGGISPGARMAIVPFMFVAAAGFIVWGWTFLVKGDQATLDGLHWPWAPSDGNGAKRLLMALLLFLLPSALWLEATRIHIESPASWTPAFVVGILFLVSLGNALMILLTFAAYKDGVARAKWALWGLLAMFVQVTINDLLIWSIQFPW